jgi:hypothetical protein
MISNYLINYFHLFLVHVGAWTTLYGAMAIKDGKEIHIKKMLSISFLLAIFSSLSHNHFSQFLK